MRITASELKEKLQAKEDILLLDVRTQQEFDSWKIEGAVNIPVQELTAKIEELPKKEIVAICAHGQRSQFAANILASYNFKAFSLEGGMASWNSVLDFVSLCKKDFEIIQVKRVGKGCIGYLLISRGQIAVIDPTINFHEYINFSKNIGGKITKIIDTHQHADHVSGSRLLQKESKADLFLNSLDGYGFSGYRNLEENKTVGVGDIDLQIIQTPGHTKGSTSFLINNEFLFTGDTLFVEGIARPDLKDKSEEFASELYETYQNKILNLSPKTVIASAHCKNGAILGQPATATLDWVKKNNRVFELSKAEFVKYVVANIPPKPFNYEHIINANRGIANYTQSEISELEFGANKCIISI